MFLCMYVCGCKCAPTFLLSYLLNQACGGNNEEKIFNFLNALLVRDYHYYYYYFFFLFFVFHLFSFVNMFFQSVLKCKKENRKKFHVQYEWKVTVSQSVFNTKYVQTTNKWLQKEKKKRKLRRKTMKRVEVFQCKHTYVCICCI